MSPWPCSCSPRPATRRCSTCRGARRWRTGRRTSWSRCRAASPGTSCASSGSARRSTPSRRSARTRALREYGLLRQLERREMPAVEAVAVVSGRVDDTGAAARPGADHPAPAVLAALPRAVLLDPARRHRQPAARRAGRAARAAAHRRLLLGRLLALQHAVPPRRRRVRGVPRRRRDRRAARLAVRRASASYDLDLARTNIAGELLDLEAGGLLHESIDPVDHRRPGGRALQRPVAASCSAPRRSTPASATGSTSGSAGSTTSASTSPS